MSQNTEYLIDQLDQRLAGGETTELQAKLLRDQDMAGEWQVLNTALEAIRENGLYEQVSAVRHEYQAENTTRIAPAKGKLVSFNRVTLRAAAVLILLFSATAIYKYATVNSLNVYDQYYHSFELSTSRGSASADQMEKAYREKHWQEVINLFNSTETKTNKSYFLTGMANLELKNPAAAIPMFNQILENNKQQPEAYFQDEAEYYLALSYLGNNNIQQAIPILKKIRADKNHLYNQAVENMSGLDLKIIEYKSGK